MAVAETHRRVGAHHVEIAAAVRVPEPHALAALEYRRQRCVVGGTEAALRRAQPVGGRTERGEHELGDPVRTPVVGIEIGPVLDDLEPDQVGAGAQSEQGVSERARGSMPPGSGQVTAGKACGSSASRSRLRPKPASGSAREAERVGEYRGQPAGAHLAHREDAHPQPRQQRQLFGLPGARANDAGACRVECGAGDAGERGMACAQQRGERHAVDVAGVGGGVGVAVEVRVDPDQAGRARAVGRCRARCRPQPRGRRRAPAGSGPRAGWRCGRQGSARSRRWPQCGQPCRSRQCGLPCRRARGRWSRGRRNAWAQDGSPFRRRPEAGEALP